jgi:hypothetical protein
VTSYGPQRFIALSSPGQPSNYDPLPQWTVIKESQL